MPKVFKQYILPVMFTDARRVEMRLNVDNDDFYQSDPTEELTLNRRCFELTKKTMSELERLTQDENADPVPGRMEIVVTDCNSYSGVLGDGTPVSEVLAKGNQRGLWDSATSYVVDDIVTTEDNLSWIAIAGSAGSPHRPDISPTDWQPWAATLGQLIFRDHEMVFEGKLSQQWKNTLAADTTIGATSISLVDLSPSTDHYEITFGEGTANQERIHGIRVSGSGPYTITLDSALAYVHTAGETVWIRELFFEGDIDPDIIPQTPSVVYATAGLNDNVVAHIEQTIQFRMTELIGRAQKLLVKYLIEGNPVTGLPNENPLIRGQRFTGFQQSDMDNSDGTQLAEYAGITFDKDAPDNIHYGNFKAPNYFNANWQSWEPETKIYVLASYDTSEFDGIYRKHYRYMYRISYASILSKIAEFLGVEFDSSLCTTGMKGWEQHWNSTTTGWDDQQHIPAVNYFEELTLNYNFWFGVRWDFDPFGDVKRYFTCPITWDKDGNVIQILNETADFFGCDIDIEYNQQTLKPRLVLKDKRELRDALPANYELSPVFGVADNTYTKERVLAGNKADDAKLSAPKQNGDALTIEIAPRLKNFGRKIGLLTADCVVDPKLKPAQNEHRFWYRTDPGDSDDANHWVYPVFIGWTATSTGSYNSDGLSSDLTGNDPDSFTVDMEGHQIQLNVGGSPKQVLILEVKSATVIRIDDLLPAGTHGIDFVFKSTPNPDGYLGAAMVMYRYDSDTNFAYPSGWDGHSNDDASGGTSWKGYYCLTAWEYKPGDFEASPGDIPPEPGYVSANSVWGPLQLYTNELVGHKTALHVVFSSLAEPDGSFANIKPGRTFTANGIKYRSIKTGAHPIHDTMSGTFVDVSPDYPALKIYKTFPIGQFGATTGGSLGTTGGGGGGAGDTPLDEVSGYVATSPGSDQRNLILPTATAEPLEAMLPTGGTQNFASFWSEDGSARLAKIDNAGKGFFTGVDAGSEQVKNVDDPTDAQDAVTLAYLTTATGNFVSKVPNGSTVTNNIVIQGATARGLTIQAHASQSGNVLELRDSGGTAQTYFDQNLEFRTAGNIYVGTNANAYNVQATNKVTSAATASGDGSTVCVTKDWAVTLKPDASNTNVIQAQNTSTVAVQFKGASGGTQNITRHVDSSGNVVGAVSYTGTLSITPSSGQGVLITSAGASLVITNTATAASATNVIEVSNTGTNGRGQHTVASDGTVTFGPLDNTAAFTGGFAVSGVTCEPYHTISAAGPTQLDGKHSQIVCNTGANSVTVKLPALTKGMRMKVKKQGAANTVFVQTTGGGAVWSWTASGQGFEFISDGSTGFAIAGW